MNDFTKEELETIKVSLDWTFPSKQTYETSVVLKKVNSMIDNYKEPCSHELTRRLVQIDLCEKCSVFRFVFEGIKHE